MGCYIWVVYDIMGCVYVVDCGVCCICTDIFSVMWQGCVQGELYDVNVHCEFSVIDYANMSLMDGCAMDGKK